MSVYTWHLVASSVGYVESIFVMAIPVCDVSPTFWPYICPTGTNRIVGVSVDPSSMNVTSRSFTVLAPVFSKLNRARPGRGTAVNCQETIFPFTLASTLQSIGEEEMTLVADASLFSAIQARASPLLRITGSRTVAEARLAERYDGRIMSVPSPEIVPNSVRFSVFGELLLLPISR